MTEKKSRFIPSKKDQNGWLFDIAELKGALDIIKTEIEPIPPWSDFLSEQLISHARDDRLERASGNTQTDEITEKHYRLSMIDRRIQHERESGVVWMYERLFDDDNILFLCEDYNIKVP